MSKLFKFIVQRAYNQVPPFVMEEARKVPGYRQLPPINETNLVIIDNAFGDLLEPAMRKLGVEQGNPASGPSEKFKMSPLECRQLDTPFADVTLHFAEPRRVMAMTFQSMRDPNSPRMDVFAIRVVEMPGGVMFASYTRRKDNPEPWNDTIEGTMFSWFAYGDSYGDWQPGNVLTVLFDVIREERAVSAIDRSCAGFRVQQKVGKPRFMQINPVVHIYTKPRGESLRNAGGGGLEFSHRFYVMGHWRRVPGIGCNRDGERSVEGRTWVAPYIKGPDDKPLLRKQRHYHAGETNGQ